MHSSHSDACVTSLQWINSVTVDNLPYILGQACAANCVRDLKTPPKIHLIPRPGSAAEKRGESATVVEGNTGFVYHHCNAYEEGGSVVLDSIHYPCYPNVCADEADRDQSNPDAAFILKAQRCGHGLSSEHVSTALNDRYGPGVSEELGSPVEHVQLWNTAVSGLVCVVRQLGVPVEHLALGARLRSPATSQGLITACLLCSI